VDVDHCHDARAIYYVEPIDDLVLRHYGKEGRLAEATLILGRFAKGAFTQKAGEIPLLKEKLDALLAQSGALRSRTRTARCARCSTASRRASCSTRTSCR
jgi:NAD-specific glutamate dehydrogenase